MESAAIYIFSLHAFADAAAIRDVTYIETQKAVRAGARLSWLSGAARTAHPVVSYGIFSDDV